MLKKGSIIAGLLLLLLSGCSDSPTESNQAVPDLLELTPMPNEQAELIAIWTSEQITAPLSYYNRIVKELEIIETKWGDSLEVWDDYAEWGGSIYQGDDVVFVPPWEISFLEFQTDSAYTQNVFDSTYQDLYALLDSLHYIELTYNQQQYYPVTFSVTFKGRLNSKLVGERLSQIDGIISVKIRPAMYIGSISNLYPLIDNTSSHYFFYYGYNDCPSNCIDAQIYYVKITSDSAYIAGSYNTEHDPVEPGWIDSLLLPVVHKWNDDEFDWPE